MQTAQKIFFATLLALAPVSFAADGPKSDLPPAGKFLGLFTKTDVFMPLAQQAERLPQLFKRNPNLKGLTMRVTWRELEPADGQFNFDGFDRLVKFTRDEKLHLTFELFGGILAPEWIYTKGVQSFETTENGVYSPLRGKTLRQPVPWDATYQKLWRRLVSEVARRHGDEPNLIDVTVHGHNREPEMHMPRTPDDMEKWKKLGWSVERVEQDWHSWIDFFAATFPKPRITLILSPMYDRSTQELPAKLAGYAIQKYPGRINLMTQALSGRGNEMGMMQMRVLTAHPEVTNTHEFLASFRQPSAVVPGAMRQGTLEMTVYNMRQLSPLFVRPLDAGDVELCSKLVKEYEHARGMPLDDYRKDLESRRLWVIQQLPSVAPAKLQR